MSTDQVEPVKSESDAERRQATILFADLSGYTALSEEIGEESTYALAQQVIGIMMTAVEAAGGLVSDVAGDGLMALFGAVDAREEAPLDACRAALAIHKAMAELAEQETTDLPMAPKVRIGINSGLVIVGKLAKANVDSITALGDAVNLASRFENIADPGTTLIGATTYAMVRGVVDAEFLGKQEIRGKTEPQAVYRLDAVNEDLSRFESARAAIGLSEFVARNVELEKLLALRKKARRSLQITNIVGEAGIGKSRILHEFQQIELDDEATILLGDCLPGGEQTPMLPLAAMLRHAFGISLEEPAIEALEKVTNELQVLGMNNKRTRALVLNFLGLELLRGGGPADDPVLLRQETVDLLLEFIRLQSGQRPLILIFEDLHWIDPVSEAFFSRMQDVAEDLPVLMVFTFRPEYTPNWQSEEHINKLQLDALPRSAIEDFLHNRLGSKTHADRLVDFVQARSDGNPLFAEHIIDFCRDHGYITEKNGVWDLTELLPREELPDSLQSLILARLDSLDPRVKSVLQAASVIGRRFRRVALEHVLGDNNDLDGLLDQALRVSMIETGEGVDEFIFRHALLSDVLYQSLLTPRRRELHSRAAVDLRSRHSNRLHDVADRLAHHYEIADAPINTARFLVLGAEHDMAIHALEEAKAKFTKAEPLIPAELRSAEADTVSRMASGMVRTFDRMAYYRDVVDYAEAYLPFLKDAGNADDYLIVMAQYAIALCHGERYEESIAVAELCSDMAESQGNSYYLAYSKLTLMTIYSRYSDKQPVDVVEKLGAECLPIAEKISDPALESNILFELAIYYMHRGLINDAHEFAQKLSEMGKRHNDPRINSFALWTRGFLDLVLEQFDDALVVAEESMRVAVTRQDVEGARGTLGCIYAANGQTELGLSYLKTAIDRAYADADYFYSAGLELYYSVALVRAGQLREGVELINERMEKSNLSGYRTNYHYGKLVLAEIYLALILRQEKAPLSVLLKNLGFLLKTLPGLAAKTEKLFREAIENPQWHPESVGHCRVYAGLGLLFSKTKNFEKARQYLRQASDLARVYGAQSIEQRVQQALTAL